MSLRLEDLFPQVQKGGFHGAGFLFGCGTSRASGYPLMTELTAEVFSGLTAEERRIVEDLLGHAGLSYDSATNSPDIEVVYDLILQALHSGSRPDLSSLDEKLRALILQVFRQRVKNHDISLHVRFLNALRNRSGVFGEPIWIFTTNYDVLFELAAAEARVSIVTGFDGPIRRFFDIAKFSRVEGVISSEKTFRHHPRVVLVKLHGSMAWTKCGEKVYEAADHIAGNPGSCSVTVPPPLN